MRVDRRLVVGAIIAYVSIALLLLYFRFFPTLVSAEFTNALVVGALIILVGSLVFSILHVRTGADVLLALPPLALATFLARAIPNLRLALPPLQDPYYHFICTENIIRHGTIESQVNSWYGYSPVQLHWPDMHLLTVDLNLVGGVELMDLYRFQEPLVGVIFLLAVYLVARALTGKENVALLAGAFAAFSDVVIFYQAEYHPQGLAFVFFALLLYVLVRSWPRDVAPFAAVFLILTAAITISHHFSSLLMSLLAFGALFMSFVVSRLGLFSYGRLELMRDRIMWLSLGVLTLSYHVFVYDVPLKEYLDMLPIHLLPTASFATFDLSAPTTYPALLALLTSLKWLTITMALGLLIFVMARRRLDANRTRLAIILFLLSAVGTAFYFVPSAPSDRVLAFAMPLVGIFASILLVALYENRRAWSKRRPALAFLVVLMLASVPMVGGILNSASAPAYILQGTEPNQNYYYDNDLPDMVEYRLAALFGNQAMAANATVGVMFDTKAIMLYYGGFPDISMKDPPEMLDDYYVINPVERLHVINNNTQFSHAQYIYANPSINIVAVQWY